MVFGQMVDWVAVAFAIEVVLVLGFAIAFSMGSFQFGRFRAELHERVRVELMRYWTTEITLRKNEEEAIHTALKGLQMDEGAWTQLQEADDVFDRVNVAFF